MKKTLAVVAFLVCLLLIGSAGAVPAKPGTVTVAQPDGTLIEVQQFGDERGGWIENLDGQVLVKETSGYYIPSPEKPQIFAELQKSFSPQVGEVLEPKGYVPPTEPNKAPMTSSGDLLVILINFVNTSQGANSTAAYYENLIFNQSNPASMWAYYNETSYGQFSLTGTIAGNKWYSSQQIMSHYGADTNCPTSVDDLNNYTFELTREALIAADADIDYSSYDDDANAIIDSDELNIIIIHAGAGQEASVMDCNRIWSHKWSVFGSSYGFNDLILDGVELSKKTGLNESYTNAGSYAMLAEDSTVGIFAHEFGHMLGLPDLYSTSGGSATRIGNWGVMDHGSWNDNGDTPSHFCAWSKYFLGWVNPVIITSGTQNITIPAVESSNLIYMLLNSSYNGTGYIPDTSGSEYFLIENRQQTGFDTAIPGNGLLILHIDDSVGSISSNNINNDNAHKRVDVESTIDPSVDYGNENNTWKNNEAGFSKDSTPNSDLYDSTPSNVSVTNISVSGNLMSAILTFPNSAPVASNIEITPTNADTSNNLTCNYTYTDLNEDPESGTIIKWFLAGVEQASFENQSIVDSVNTTRSQVWTCTVAPSDGSIYGTTQTSANLTIQNAIPVIEVTAPNGGEFWNATHIITWTSLDADLDTMTIDLYYTYNGTWMEIAANQFDLGVKDWNVSELPSSANYLVKAVADDGTDTGEDTSDSVFAIGTKMTTNVAYPNGGEILTDTVSVIANVTHLYGLSAIDNVSFYYSNDSTNWILIDSSTTPSGDEYNVIWNTSTISDGNTYEIKVSIIDNESESDFDISDDTFIVNNVNSAPVLAVIAPNGGEEWSGTKAIQWSANDSDGDTLSIDIQYSADNTEWTNISCNETNDGEYSWDTNTVSNGNDYKIRIFVYDPYNLSVIDTSDTDFAIDNSASGGDDDDEEDTSEGGSYGAGSLASDSGWQVKVFNVVNVGEKATWTINNAGDLALTSIELVVNDILGDVKLKSRKLDSQPSSISVVPAGQIYQFYEMDTSNLPSGNVFSVSFKFKLPKSWFVSNNLDETSVSLRRWGGNGWTKLKTTKYDEDASSYYFQASSSGFSYFAISAIAKEGSATEELEEKQLGPDEDTGFGAIIGGAAAVRFQEFLDNQTLKLENKIWLGLLIITIVMSVVFAALVFNQRNLKGRFPGGKLKQRSLLSKINKKRTTKKV